MYARPAPGGGAALHGKVGATDRAVFLCVKSRPPGPIRGASRVMWSSSVGLAVGAGDGCADRDILAVCARVGQSFNCRCRQRVNPIRNC